LFILTIDAGLAAAGGCENKKPTVTVGFLKY